MIVISFHGVVINTGVVVFHPPSLLYVSELHRSTSPAPGYPPVGKPAVMNRVSWQRGGVVKTRAADLKHYA